MHLMKHLFFSITLVSITSLSFSQTARIQAIHNSADMAAGTVDVWLIPPVGSPLMLLDDFSFRTASPFIDAPAGAAISIAVAPANSSSIADTIAGLTSTYTLTPNETYILIAGGIVSTSGYSPAIPFGINVYAMGQEEATMSGNTDVLVHHGSTDAPTVDVRERTLATTVVNDASYGDYAGYLNLATADYILDVQDATGTTTVASYSAPLSSLGLADSAIVVVASGFLDPSMNSNGPAFGLWVALPEGGNLIELPAAPAPTARVNIIHNSADAAADSVDVYVNGTLTLDNFAFRTATGFIDLPATAALQVGIAPKTSSSINDTIPGAVFNYNLGIDETYVIVADGIVSASGYSPAQPFTLNVYAMGQEEATTTGNTDVLVHHGSTDAPVVDVDEVTAGNLVDDAAYGDFAGYLNLATADYILEVKDAPGTTTLATYSAPLATLGLEDSAIVVVASGFLTPANNSNGPAFGLYVALGTGGNLVPLPAVSLSVGELDETRVEVYPNPTTDFITIDGVELSDVEATIVDVNGKVVRQAPLNNTQMIDVSELSQGTYFLILMRNNSVFSVGTTFVKN